MSQTEVKATTVVGRRARSLGAEESGRASRVTVVRPAPRWPDLDVHELWHYRELLATFVWRDLKVRYKQTFVGVAWAILQPFLTMVVFTLVIGKFGKFPHQTLPTPVFILSGLILWQYFSSSMTLASVSLVSNINLVTKVYFPRVLLPFATVLTPAVDFLFACLVLGGVSAYYDVAVSDRVWTAPVFVLLAVTMAFGAGMLLSTVNVRYRDVPYIVPYLLQIGMFVSAVFYPIQALPARWQWVFALNPMNSAISGFRWAVFGTPLVPLGQIAVSVGAVLVVLIGGLVVFRKSEPRFADMI